MSYGLRFIFDAFLSGDLYFSNRFAYYLVYDALGFIDCITFMALLFLHRANFTYETSPRLRRDSNKSSLSLDDDLYNE